MKTRAQYPTRGRSGGQRLQYSIDYIPPALWRQVRATALREGVSIRELILDLLSAWVRGRRKAAGKAGAAGNAGTAGKPRKGAGS